MVRTQTKPIAIPIGFAIGVGLFSCAFFSTIGLLTFAMDRPLGTYTPSSSDAASWVQAIGSIGAIVGSFLLGAWQTREAAKLATNQAERMELSARRLEHATKIERHGLFLVIVEHNIALAERIALAMKNSDTVFLAAWHALLRNQASAGHAALDAIPVVDLGSAEQVKMIFEMKGKLLDVFSMAERAAAAGTLPAVQKRLDGIGDEADKDNRALRSLLEKLTNSYHDSEKALNFSLG